MNLKKMVAFLGVTLLLLSIAGFYYLLIGAFASNAIEMNDKIDVIKKYDLDYENRSDVKSFYDITKEDAGWFSDDFDITKNVKEFLDADAEVMQYEIEKQIAYDGMHGVNVSNTSAFALGMGYGQASERLNKSLDLRDVCERDIEYAFRDGFEDDSAANDGYYIVILLLGIIIPMIFLVVLIISLYMRAYNIKSPAPLVKVAIPEPVQASISTQPFRRSPMGPPPFSTIPPPHVMAILPYPLNNAPDKYCEDCNIVYNGECPLCKIKKEAETDKEDDSKKKFRTLEFRDG